MCLRAYGLPVKASARDLLRKVGELSPFPRLLDTLSPAMDGGLPAGMLGPG